MWGKLGVNLETVLVVLLCLRVCQRVYYFLKGHVQHLGYRPRHEMERFLQSFAVTDHVLNITQKSDGVPLTLRYEDVCE